MTNDIDALAPDVVPVAKTFVAELLRRGIRHKVTSTLRTAEEQLALYAQGRAQLSVVNALRKNAGMYILGEKENGYTVTNCDGVNNKSRHQGGKAMDVVPLGNNGNPVWPPVDDARWLQIAEVGESYGLSWGGRWMTPDCPHYELRA